MLGTAQVDIAFGQVGCNRQRNRFVAVAQQRVTGTMQTLHTLYHDTAVNLDLDNRAHLLQKLDQVNDLWLQGSILNDGDPPGQ